MNLHRPSTGGGGDWVTSKLVAYGDRHSPIVTTATDNLRSAPFTPVQGATYIARWFSAATESFTPPNIASGVSNNQPHFCRAVETDSGTIHNIGLGAPIYSYAKDTISRPIDFIWTAGTSNEVRIELGQPTTLYGVFQGTLLIYEVQPKARCLGWGGYGAGYSWATSTTLNGSSTLGSGVYTAPILLDSAKTYAFWGRWSGAGGYSLTLALRSGTNYWRLPNNSNIFATATSATSSWNAGTYYDPSFFTYKGELIRVWSPPSTASYEIAVPLYNGGNGVFWLIELD